MHEHVVGCANAAAVQSVACRVRQARRRDGGVAPRELWLSVEGTLCELVYRRPPPLVYEAYGFRVVRAVASRLPWRWGDLQLRVVMVQRSALLERCPLLVRACMRWVMRSLALRPAIAPREPFL